MSFRGRGNGAGADLLQPRPRLQQSAPFLRAFVPALSPRPSAVSRLGARGFYPTHPPFELFGFHQSALRPSGARRLSPRDRGCVGGQVCPSPPPRCCCFPLVWRISLEKGLRVLSGLACPALGGPLPLFGTIRRCNAPRWGAAALAARAAVSAAAKCGRHLSRVAVFPCSSHFVGGSVCWLSRFVKGGVNFGGSGRRRPAGAATAVAVADLAPSRNHVP